MLELWSLLKSQNIMNLFQNDSYQVCLKLSKNPEYFSYYWRIAKTHLMSATMQHLHDKTVFLGFFPLTLSTQHLKASCFQIIKIFCLDWRTSEHFRGSGSLWQKYKNHSLDRKGYATPSLIHSSLRNMHSPGWKKVLHKSVKMKEPKYNTEEPLKKRQHKTISDQKKPPTIGICTWTFWEWTI